MNRRVVLAIGAVSVALTTISACNFPGNKVTEPWNDAPISHKDDGPAVVYSMPDGFGNVAAKCDGYGHRIFTLYHADGTYGGVSVVADPACAG
jgi:hypothetical protein